MENKIDKCKIVVLGEYEVGKTSLIEKFVNDRIVEIKCTGASCASKKLNIKEMNKDVN